MRLFFVATLFLAPILSQASSSCQSAFSSLPPSDQVVRYIQYGEIQNLKNLLRKKDINVNQQDTNGFLPLHVALIFQREDAARLLVERYKANVHAISPSTDNAPPLFLTSDNTKNLKLLIKYGVSRQVTFKEYTVAHMAAFLNNFSAFTELTKKSSKLSDPLSLNEKDQLGNTPLFYATQKESSKNAKTIKKLVHAGANINAINNEGQTALHYSIMHDNTTAFVTLLLLGADANIQNNNGQTPLDLAQSLNKEKASEWLELYNAHHL